MPSTAIGRFAPVIEPQDAVPEVEPVPGRPKPVARWVSAAGTLLGFAILAAIAVGVVFGLVAIYPDDVVEPRDADFLDNIFANEFVLFAARLVLFSAAAVAFFAAGYTILSVIQLGKKGQWLRRAGPFEVAEAAVADLSGEIEFWRGIAESSGEELEDLRQQLQKNDEVIERLWDRINDLENENVELRAAQPPPP
jgi:hypothetical protein